jgi:hypothetical protein
MTKPIELKPGDNCPSCDGRSSRRACRPTSSARGSRIAKSASRSRRGPTPRTKRSASELGALYLCRDCGYQTRFPIAAETT